LAKLPTVPLFILTSASIVEAEFMEEGKFALIVICEKAAVKLESAKMVNNFFIYQIWNYTNIIK
jgi:hypothetical protein